MEENKEVVTQENENANPKSILEKLSRGTLVLNAPIRSRGQDVNELEYDFMALSATEYANIMDSDMNSANPFRMTKKQAIALFAAAAEKCASREDEKGGKYMLYDAVDVRQRMSIQDAIRAAQLADVFFTVSSRLENNRVLNR